MTLDLLQDLVDSPSDPFRNLVLDRTISLALWGKLLSNPSGWWDWTGASLRPKESPSTQQ